MPSSPSRCGSHLRNASRACSTHPHSEHVVEAQGNRGRTRAQPDRFDPYLILSALERHRVSYVAIGGFARVVHGTDEITHGLDISLSLRRENIARANRALAQLEARTSDGQPANLSSEPAPVTR